MSCQKHLQLLPERPSILRHHFGAKYMRACWRNSIAWPTFQKCTFYVVWNQKSREFSSFYPFSCASITDSELCLKVFSYVDWIETLLMEIKPLKWMHVVLIACARLVYKIPSKYNFHKLDQNCQKLEVIFSASACWQLVRKIFLRVHTYFSMNHSCQKRTF